MSGRALSILFFFVGALSAATFAGSCSDDPTPNPSGGQGGMSADGGCPMTPVPMFTVTISTEQGIVPPDTSLSVTWSEGQEPIFQLNDPSTWNSADGEANVVCDVDPAKPPPIDLASLVCRLWTSGATEIEVKAEGYSRHTETLVPMLSEECEGPIPKEVSVTLTVEQDGGAPP